MGGESDDWLPAVEYLRPLGCVAVAELADRAGVTRATFYNRSTRPLELLIQVLDADLDRCAHPVLPGANHEVIAQFVAHGFAGAIQAWRTDDAVAKDDLVDAALACAPAWWT
ncbi:hypothetical protein [Streptomyces sp. CB01635]|uniref:hypothetical protein n=1 Tax=unclassified Streptomyces TaxID=2593676 RepID=UPI0018FE68B9|nr:hypothetical protein [Streptomyces sp. CB01635]